jgi:hypothetical protein
MRTAIKQFGMVFTSPSQAVDSHPAILVSLLWSCLVLCATFALLLINSLNTSIISLSPVQLFVGGGRLESFLANFAVQMIVLCIPFAIVLGMDGIKKLLANLAIIEVPGLVMALFGFLYETVFWHLYKLLPVSGLGAKAAFDAFFLLYPALLMLVYRYVLIWIVAVKAGADGRKIFLMTAIYLVLCVGLYVLGGVL